jgi:kumamolisin
VHPRLYGTVGSFQDITSGNNGAYQAGAGWDPCTGLGTPDGTAILTALQGS